VARGATPYAADDYGPLGSYSYAPAFAYLLMPLHSLDYVWACRSWLVVNWLATALVFVLSASLVLGPKRPPAERWGVLLLSALATGGYVWANVRVGQAAALLVLGCLAWAACRRAGWPYLGGIILAAACALKLSPGLLLADLILRRDRRGLAGVATGALALFAFPAAWVGWDGAVQLHREWTHHLLATQIPEQTYRPGNQSLLAQLARLPMVGDGHRCTSPENLVLLSRSYPLVIACLAVVLFAWIGRRWGWTSRAGQGRQAETLLPLALLFVFLTLAHPRAWRCNFTALVLPCTLLAEAVWHGRPSWRASLAGLVALPIACAWPTAGANEAGWSLAGWLLLGKHFWAAVLVGCCMLRCQRPGWPGRTRTVPRGGCAPHGASAALRGHRSPGRRRSRSVCP
jgi:hypothetical protein